MSKRYSTTHTKLKVAGAPGYNATIRMVQPADEYYTSENFALDAQELYDTLRYVLPEPTWRRLATLCASEQEREAL